MDLIEEPFFDELRTKRQLGYVVCTGLTPSGGTVSAEFMVQGKHRPEELEHAMEAFLDSFHDTLVAMPDEHFEKHRAALAAAWLEKFKCMSECVGARSCSADRPARPPISTASSMAAVLSGRDVRAHLNDHADSRR